MKRTTQKNNKELEEVHMLLRFLNTLFQARKTRKDFPTELSSKNIINRDLTK